MPYQLTGAKVRSKGEDRQWSDADLSAMPINVIFATYGKIYLQLTHPALPKAVWLDMDTARPLMGVSTVARTISQWLISMGNAALPTLAMLPDMTPKVARYTCAWRAGYDVKAIAVGRHHNSQINEGDKHDLLISKKDVDFLQNSRYCLVTVNGFFHRVGGSDEGLHVVDGARSTRIARDNQIGLHDFREIGPMELIPITPSMIYKQNADGKLGQYAYIKMPYDISKKTVFVVIGGYMHALDDVYKVIGAQSLRIDFNNMALPERLYDSQRHINLKALMIEDSVNNAEMRSVEQLYSDQLITAYLTLPQSFLVIIDAESVYVRKHNVENMGLPGRYMTHWPVERFPLYSGYGRCYDYRMFPKDQRCMLATEPAKIYDYNFRTENWRLKPAIDDTQLSSAPWRFAEAWMLEIGRT